jgi:ABC-type phosphate transport system substrate-binding protein
MTMRFLWMSLVLALAGAAAAEEPVPAFRVIVDERNPVSRLSAKEVEALFLKKTSRWEDGTAVVPIDQRPNPTREAFTKSALNRSVRAVQAYWQQRVFTGQGLPPKEAADDGAVQALVKASPGAIGYVSGAFVPSAGVKVVTITP